MKLFDFKFIILLGLALVIYFIYKELEFQRERLTYCEEKIKEIVGKLTFNVTNLTPLYLDKKQDIVKDNDQTNEENNETTNDENNELIDENNELIDENNELIDEYENKEILIEDKNLSILLPEKTLIEYRVKSTSDTSASESSSLINTKSSYTSSPSDSIILSPDSKKQSDSKKESESKHLEIYSNDNDNNVETTISDSLVVSKLEKTDVKNNIVVENMLNSNFLTKKSIKSLENKIDINSSQELENAINALKNELDNTDSEQKTVTSKNGSNLFSKMKLPELQSLAKKENLSLEKNINGHQKKKTKHELIEELSKI